MSQVNRDPVDAEGVGAEDAGEAEAWTAFINAIGTDGLGVYDDDGDEGDGDFLVDSDDEMDLDGKPATPCVLCDCRVNVCCALSPLPCHQTPTTRQMAAAVAVQLALARGHRGIGGMAMTTAQAQV